MKLNRVIGALTLVLLVGGCSSGETGATKEKIKQDRGQTSQAVARTNSEYFTVLEFDKGTQRLNEKSKRDLREFVASAKKDGREINDIRILAWADREYPGKGARLNDRDVKIAKERTESIVTYLKDDLNTDGNYATYNMAKRPNKVSEFFRGDDYKTKRVFEKTGAAPAGSELTAFMSSKASKAVIMVDYE